MDDDGFMNHVIEEIYRDRKVIGPDGQVINPFPTSIGRTEGEMLYQVVRHEHARATLEVGMAWGVSSLFMCQALHDAGGGKHVAIDPYQGKGFGYAGLKHLERAGLKHLLEFREEPSHLALPELVRAGWQFDVVFIDGAHRFDQVLVDFYYADCLISPGKCLIFDDLWMPAIRKVLHFILRNRHYEIVQEYLGPKPAFLARHWQNLRYQTRKLLSGRRNLGAPPETRFHLWRNVNWTVLRKLRDDDRVWDHFAAF